MKKIAVLQSNYIPWKGYFDIIAYVDEFILYDDMQYTRRDWRNRNKIKTPEGLMWLTIPVETKGKYLQRIRDTKVSGHEWCQSHLRALEINYAHTPFFRDYYASLSGVYAACAQEESLSMINYRFLAYICEILGIKTRISWSWDYPLAEGKTKRLVELVKAAGGQEYLSGPAARDYIEEELFEKDGIRLSWMDYSGYPAYQQLYGPFEHGVTILDLLFHTGPEAPSYMKYVN